MQHANSFLSRQIGLLFSFISTTFLKLHIYLVCVHHGDPQTGLWRHLIVHENLAT